jgi:sulfite reductase (NADPH) flavoprotein alpha-component
LVAALYSQVTPIQLDIKKEQSWGEALALASDELGLQEKRGTFAQDIRLRYPALRKNDSLGAGIPIIVTRGNCPSALPKGSLLCFAWRDKELELAVDARSMSEAAARMLSERVSRILAECLGNNDKSLSGITALSIVEEGLLLNTWQRGATPYANDKCVHQLIEQQVAQTPNGIALVFRDGELSYAELDRRANAVAVELQALGVGPDVLVGILTSKLSLGQPTRKLIEFLASKAIDPVERSRLDGLLAKDAAPDLVHYLANHEYADALAEFPSAPVAPQELVALMRKLMPRLYSIASSQRVSGDEVHLTVAIVRYETNGRQRGGVCTTFLADRVQTGETPVPVFVSHSHFGLPESGEADLIMVGPGTGIAPFRAFLHERRATGAKGRNWLFFGDQRRASDFLYADEFDAMLRDGLLARLDLAFSRDQAHKIYVQDRMREAGADLWAWLQRGAYFCVCGDAKRMAKDVDAELHAIARQHGGMDEAAAVAYVKQLKKDRRYMRDVY